MTLLHAAALGLSLGILPSPRVDVAAGARTELGAGYIPTTPTAPVEPGVQATVTARGGLRLVSPTSTFLLRAGPQLFWLVPNIAGLHRPLLFSNADLNYTTNPTERLTTNFFAMAGFGELSYSTLSQVFVPGTTAVESAIVPIALVNVEGRAAYRTTRVLTTTLAARFGAQAPWSDPDIETTALPTFRTFGLDLTNDLRLGPVDTISPQVSAELFSSNEGGDFVTLRTTVAWTHLTGPRSSVRGLAGAEWIRSTDPESDYVLPQGTLEHQTGGGNRRTPWTLRSSLGVRGFFDRLSFVYMPQSFARVDFDKTWSPDFGTGLGVFASTSISERPAAPGLFETFAGFEIPNRYRLTDTLRLTFGARASLRGLHLSEFDMDQTFGQLLLFVGLDWAEGTDPNRGDFVR